MLYWRELQAMARGGDQGRAKELPVMTTVFSIGTAPHSRN